MNNFNDNYNLGENDDLNKDNKNNMNLKNQMMQDNNRNYNPMYGQSQNQMGYTDNNNTYGNMNNNMHGNGNMNNQMQNGGYPQQNGMNGYSQNQMYGQPQNQMYGNQMQSNMNVGVQMPNMGYAPMENMNTDFNLNNNQAPQFDMDQISEYKKILRNSVEVQRLTNEVEIQNPNSIIMFGQGASENISKISDELLSSMRSVKAEEASEMLVNLTKIMDKFDIKELEKPEKSSALSKLMKSVGNTVAKLFQKYDSMGMEVEKVYVLLKKYESDIKESNAYLKKLYDGNIHYYQLLEKYIVAGELAIEEIDQYIAQVQGDQTINQEQKQMMIQKLEIGKDMLSQRVYDLQIAENVAIQAAPMIQTIQMSNFNLMRKINSSFIVTLPIFKQCLAQAIILKRQEIQAKSIKQLDEKTNELIMRNAQNTARQSVEIAKMASGSSVALNTLEKSYETIMKGIEETKSIQEANRQERMENSKKLEIIKHEMKKNISN